MSTLEDTALKLALEAIPAMVRAIYNAMQEGDVHTVEQLSQGCPTAQRIAMREQALIRAQDTLDREAFADVVEVSRSTPPTTPPPKGT